MSKALYVSEKPSRRFVRRLPADLEVSVVRSWDMARALSTRESFDAFLVDTAFSPEIVKFISHNVHLAYIVLVQGRGYNSFRGEFSSAEAIIGHRPSREAVQEFQKNIEYPELQVVGGRDRGRCSVH